LQRDLVELKSADFEGVDALIHCAAHTPNHPYDTWEACLHGNALAPLTMMEKAQQAGVQRFIMAGSSFEYGRAAERYERVPVDAPLESTTSYPASKAAASVLFSAWARSHQSRLAILRIFQVYGPGEAGSRLWPALRKAADEGRDFPLNPGDLIRDFIRVEQVAAALLYAVEVLELSPGQPEIHNVGTGEGRRLADFARDWWAHWGATGSLQIGAVPYRAGEIMRCVAEPSPALAQALAVHDQSPMPDT
jgi:nucleoside-diphosphate-sugar epimerase